MSELQTVVAIVAGCAECHMGAGPLIEEMRFPSMRAAYAWAISEGWIDPDAAWTAHPQGGVHTVGAALGQFRCVVGQGSVWLREEAAP